MIKEILEHSLMITSFVFLMMIIIEYINVQTKERWQRYLKNKTSDDIKNDLIECGLYEIKQPPIYHLNIKESDING